MANPSPKSRKGVPNKATSKVKTAIALLAENNVDKMQEWLDQIAIENPLEALKFMLSLMEYNIPKLARTESAVEHSGQVNHGVLVIPPKDFLATDSEAV